MGSQEVLENSTIMDSTISLCNGRAVQHSDNIEGNENPGVDFLKDFDLLLDDINDRLTISRMVSDSVIKGMIGAVEQEAEEKIALKETELARLKESLYLYHVGSEDNECVSYSVKCHGLKIGNCGSCPRYSQTLLEHNRVQESLSNFKFAAEQQFKVLKKEIDEIKGMNSIRRRNSGSELVGLSAILQENGPDKWIDVDRTLDGLKTTLESVCEQAEDLVHLSKSSLFEWQQEREIQAEIEGMVLKNCVWGLQKEFEHKLWDQNAQSYSNGSANWFVKIKEISLLRQELDVILKSLSASESGQLSSHGSLEHRKASSNHPLSTSLREGNGKHDESIIAKPENVDLHQLKHMDKEHLVNYFKAEMMKMKRHHELEVQEMTEEYFSLKRDYLRERGSTLPVRKDKEFDSVRKKIPRIISKLDDILVENEKLPAFKNNFENLENLKDRLESLDSENHQLRDLLLDKKKEIKCLLSEVSDAEEKLVEHSVTETHLLRTVATLKCAIEDARIEALLSEDIYKLILKEEMVHIKWLSQESDMEYDVSEGLYENIFREAARNAELTSKLEFEDSDMEPIVRKGLLEVIYGEAFKEAEEKLEFEDSDMELIIMKGLLEVIYGEAFKEAEEKLEFKDSDMEPIIMKGLLEVIYGEAFKEAEETLSGLNRKWTSELENMLGLHHTEKEKLKEEVCALKAIIEEKDKLDREEADALAKEKEKVELSSQELDQLRVQIDQQKMLMSKSSEESQVFKHNLDVAMEENEHYKGEISSLTEMLELAKTELSKSVEEKRVLLAVSQEKQNALSLSEARERDHLEQLDSVKRLAIGLSKRLSDFEHRATEDLQRNGSRLAILSSQLSSLISKASRLKKTGLLYKEKLERRCSDLQKAETEVDLLGDEVDNLLSLLEKIYIALDHYSPILQHYPGIIEILKLVRRELSGESVKPV